MKLGYKIAIGTVIGFSAGYGIWRIIYNYRLSKANDRVTKDVQKELLIQQIIILQGLEDTEGTRNLYRSKTIEELILMINEDSNPAKLPHDDEEYYEPTGVSESDLNYYFDDNIEIAGEYGVSANYSNY